MSVVNQPVEDSIGDGRVSDMIVPMFHWELAGKKG